MDLHHGATRLQVVWKSTTKVGCGYRQCGPITYNGWACKNCGVLTCSYSPPGERLERLLQHSHRHNNSLSMNANDLMNGRCLGLPIVHRYLECALESFVKERAVGSLLEVCNPSQGCATLCLSASR
jgi:hypothetical protein